MRKLLFTTRRSLGVVVGAAALSLMAQHAAFATTTDNIPKVRSTTRVIAFANGIAAPAQIAYDIGMKDSAGNWYYPCKNGADPYYGACSVGAYYKVVHVTPSTGLQYGLPVNNADTDNSGKTYTHYWSQRVAQVNLEITAEDAAGQYGNARLSLSGFTIPWEGDPTHQMRTASTGVIPLPLTGASDAGRVAGYITRNGVPVASGVNLDYFGHSDTQHPTPSGAFVAYGFAGAAPNSAGYYTTKATWKGHYDVYVRDTAAGHVWLCGASVQGGVQANYDLARAGLGQPTGVCVQQS